MRMVRRITVLALLLLLHSPGLPAQDSTSIRQVEGGVVLDFQDTNLSIVIGALADVAGVNVALSNLPSRPITIRTNGAVTPREVRGYLTSLAETHDLELREQGGLLIIEGGGARRSRPEEREPPPDSALLVSEPPRLFVYRLRHARAGPIANTISTIFGAGGTRRVEGEREGRGLSAELRRQREGPLYPDRTVPRAAPPADENGTEAPGLSATLDGAVRVVPDPVTNSVLVHASPSDYETVQSAIRKIDTRPLQVLIEVLIAEVRRDDRFGVGLGIELPADSEGDALDIGAQLAGLAAGDLALQFLNLGAVNLDAVLRTFATSSDVTILSRPVVLARNNQEARILVGSQRPFVQLFRSLPTDAAFRDQVVQFREVGTQLSILPTINPDGYVSLDVLQEVSSATSEVQFGAPVISTREAETALLVKDGHTAVIGGLVDRQEEISKSGVPLLRDIPLLGGLFGSTRRTDVATELFIFLTPHVLRTDEDMEEAKEGLRNSTDSLREELKEPIPLLHDDTVSPPPEEHP